MRRCQGILALATSLVLPAIFSRAAVPAFSGADGAGAQASGGRGGIVYHVTKLDTSLSDTGPGTLHYGLNDGNFSKDASGNVQPRTIVFDVGGTIFLGLNSPAGHPGSDTEGWDTTSPMSAGSQNNLSSNITIAGQTAPGGINIVGGGLKVNGANVVMRNLEIAPGYGVRHANALGTGYFDQYAFDGMNIHASNVMVDHVTTVYATDEGISADEVANNVTIQYSTIANGQNYPQQDAESSTVTFAGHALGSLWQPGTNAKTSILHNLYANEGGRTPRFGTEQTALTNPSVGAINDFRNNVIYNWLNTGGTGASAQPSTDNFVGNYYLSGPGGQVPGAVTIDPSTGKYTVAIANQTGGTGIFNGSNGPTGVFQSGNVKDTNKNGTPEFGTAITNSDFPSSSIVGSAYSVPYNGVTDTAQSAYSRVLSFAGANWQSRGAIDTGIVSGVQTGTGTIQALNDPNNGTSWNSLLALRNTTNGGIGGTGQYARAANFDSDGDGMPDVWEMAHGLNPAVADNNGDYDNNGYTNLEEYLDESAAFPAPAPIVFNNGNGNSRYAEIGNWTTGVFQPSRYDEAQINSGTTIIDAVGQHAGTLKIATNAGNTAAVSVTSGWIDIAGSMLVAPGGAGQVNQTNGIVHAATSIVIGGTNNAGAYNLSGGILSTPLLTTGAKGGVFSFTGGMLHASQINFNLTNQGGVLAPGSDGALEMIAAAVLPDITGTVPPVPGNIGSTNVLGNLNLQSGTLQIELASLSSFDTISATGSLTLGGALDVELLNGYQPNPLDWWEIGSASSINGGFTSITNGFAVQTIGGNLFLVAVPEPGTGALLLLGGIAMFRRRKR